MNRLFVVACKALGLFQLYWALSSLLSIGMAFHMGTFTVEGGAQFEPKFYLPLTCLYSILVFFFAFMMIFKTETIARIVGLGKKDEIPHLPPQSIIMKTGLMLIGIFFLLSSIPSLVKSITDIYLSVKRTSDLSSYSSSSENLAETIAVVCQIGLAIFVLARPEAIIRLIFRKKKAALPNPRLPGMNAGGR